MKDTLTIVRADLDSAQARGLLASAAADPLWQHFAAADQARLQVAPAVRAAGPRFDFTHALYYLGGMLAIGAATLFMTEGWRRLGPWGLLLMCVAYIALCVWAARRLDRRDLPVPAGILATLAICLVPLATWAVQHGLGLWPEGGPERYAQYHTLIDWRWLTLELATLAAAAAALWWLRYPFLTMPLAFTLWYLSMDLARLVVAPTEALAWEFYRDFSLLFGLGMTLLGLWVDARSRGPGGSRRDYAFWLLLLGVLTFWGALSARGSDSELAKLAYALINVVFILFGAVIGRRVFAVCGGLGVAMYLGDLSYRLFSDSLMFPFALTAIGLVLVACGIWWQRHETRVHATLLRHAPPALRRWLAAGPG